MYWGFISKLFEVHNQKSSDGCSELKKGAHSQETNQKTKIKLMKVKQGTI